MVHKILEIENEEADHLMPDELEHGRCQAGQRLYRHPDQLSRSCRHYEQDVVPEGQAQGVPDLTGGDLGGKI